MKIIHPSPLLKIALRIDALASGATGVLQLAVSEQLATLLEIPRALLVGSGEFMLVYALALMVLASRNRLPSWLVMFVVIGNGLWALACIALPLAGALAPSGLGWANLLVQATAVGGFAAFQWLGLRRCAAASPEARHHPQSRSSP